MYNKRQRRLMKTSPYTTTQDGQNSNQQPKPAATGGRKLGVCFACGKPGHWRYEWREENEDKTKSVKISIEIQNSYDRDLEKCSIVSPVGRLANSYSKWKEIQANETVLDVIKFGYKLPFFTKPDSVILTNNKSALQNKDFVSTEIQNLIDKKSVTEVLNKPFVINPLTVAENKNKKRLVLDCRHLNPHLYKKKFKYEDQSVARDIFTKGNYVITFDLSSAYHHIEIFSEHRKYLGFAWHDGKKCRYFIFNCLPFGISTAGYIFTKVMREVVSYWRAQGHKVIMFLDDGIAGAKNEKDCTMLSTIIKQNLVDLGFLLAENKCCWTPQARAIWLGLIWDFSEGVVYITEARINKLLQYIENILLLIKSDRCVSCKFLAGIAGQIISMQAAVGKIVLLRTRNIFQCINSRASWQAPVLLTGNAENELKFWRENSPRFT